MFIGCAKQPHLNKFKPSQLEKICQRYDFKLIKWDIKLLKCMPCEKANKY